MFFPFQSYVKKTKNNLLNRFFPLVSYYILFFLKRKIYNQKSQSDNFQTSLSSQSGAKLHLKKLILIKSNRNLGEKKKL